MKMKRIWNALRYGDRMTRICIGRVIVFSVLAVIFIIISAVIGEFYLFILGMLCAVIAVICSQTFSLVEEDFVAEVNRRGKKETVNSVAAQKSEKPVKEKQEKAEKKKEQLELEEERKREELIERFANYNEKVMVKIKKKYHVKKDHRPILIDYSKNFQIKECPAFIWRIHSKVYILLLEKEPRKICISRELIRNMGYAPKIRAVRSEEYQAFNIENMVTNVFKQYLPDYHDFKEKEMQGTNLKYKNLYTIYPDIQISNRSAYEVMDLLCLNFMPQNKITESEKINGYFKRIYSANILFRDRVYRVTEYKEKIEKILSEMCYAEMPDEEFIITIENLVKGKLISEEYAEHYLELKSKIVNRKVAVSYRR